MRLIPKKLSKIANSIYKGFSGEIVSIPSIGLAVHDGVNNGGTLISSQSSAGLAGRDNFVRNSNFSSIQNGSTFPSNTSASTYTLDGWYIMHNGGSSSNVAQLATYDSETNSTTRVRATLFSGGLSSSYSRFVQTYHTISRFAGKKMTLSYYIKPTVTTSVSNEVLFSFSDVSTSDRSTLAGMSSLTANVWNKIELTFTMPSITSSDVINNLVDGMMLSFWLEAGDDWNSRTGGIAPISGSFDIANVKLEESSAATEYNATDLIFEKNKVFEYFEKSSRLLYMSNLATTQVDPLSAKVNINVRFNGLKWINTPPAEYTLVNATGGVLHSRDSSGFTVQATANSATAGAYMASYTSNAELAP